jgi:hypothetical protein
MSTEQGQPQAGEEATAEMQAVIILGGRRILPHIFGMVELGNVLAVLGPSALFFIGRWSKSVLGKVA